jgi:hypothetical protein
MQMRFDSIKKLDQKSKKKGGSGGGAARAGGGTGGEACGGTGGNAGGVRARRATNAQNQLIGMRWWPKATAVAAEPDVGTIRVIPEKWVK